jgi:hypothetical protein
MLTSAQSGKNTPGGALAIIQGVTGQSESRFLAVIKAEPDDGFTVDKSTGASHNEVSYQSFADKNAAAFTKLVF